MKILIATDGSDFSKEAIEKACEMLVGDGNNLIKIIAVYEEVAAPELSRLGFLLNIPAKWRISRASRQLNLRAKPKKRFASVLPIHPSR